MAWKKATIQIDNGTWTDAQVPEIVSASRSTDIPAFYADWFFHRLEKGTRRGQIHSMPRKVTCRTRTRALSCFGLRIQRS